MADLDMRLLRAFVAVAEDLSFTNAATRLHLAQQALSGQVRQLEDRLGVTLFERTTRRVSLTAAGSALLPHARAAIAAAEAGAVAARRAGGAEERIVVALFPLASSPLTAAILRRFAASHPELTVDVITPAMTGAVALLESGHAHVAFVRPPVDADGLSLATIETEDRVAALPAGHPLAAAESVDPAELARQPQVYVEGAGQAQADFWTLADHRDGAPMEIGARIASFDDFFGVVSAGLAVGLCPASAAAALASAFPSVAFRHVRAIAPCTVAVAWRTAGETATIRAFVRSAVAVAAEGGDDVVAGD